MRRLRRPALEDLHLWLKMELDLWGPPVLDEYFQVTDLDVVSRSDTHFHALKRFHLFFGAMRPGHSVEGDGSQWIEVV